MAQATITFEVGTETAATVLPVDLPAGETILTGDIDVVVPAGTVARLRGTCRLINNLHVRGTLTADPTGVNLDGQGLWDIHTHDGGVLDLVGVEKSAWVHWGDTVTGWQIGDRLAVAPTSQFGTTAQEVTWQGSWAATTRPPFTADFPLLNGTVARPEVANLSQTLLIRNVTRIMLHESEGAPNVHTLRWLRVLDSGKVGELTMYPIHFHFLGDTCRGSLVEGVVVEGGKHHAFVPHGSHGITFRECVAYRTVNGDAFWWDQPAFLGDTSNNSDDILYDHVLGMWGRTVATDHRLTGMLLGSGVGNAVRDSVMTCTQGGIDASGFGWPESKAIVGVWDFPNNVAHNNKQDGIFVWQNDDLQDHVIADFVAYRNGGSQIEHGAYSNNYKYRRMVLMGGAESAFKLHARGQIEIEDVQSDNVFLLSKHQFPQGQFLPVRRCQFSKIMYRETAGNVPSKVRFEDCGLTPADFDMGANNWGIVPTSLIEITEGGVLTHSWANGVWT